jgi:Tfp pilus assembly PilM family ATPase
MPETVVNDEETFPGGDSLKAFVKESKDKHKLSFISVVLPEEKTYIFRTEVPALSPEQIHESLELKLEEHVPIPPREAVFDYQVVSTLPGDRLSVSVSVIPHMVVSRYVDFFTSVDLIPVAFQISAQALTNAVIARGDDTPTIVVNFGELKTGLYLVSHRVVHFTSTVSVGGASLTEAIRKYFSVSVAEAEKIKAERGIIRGKEDAELFFSLVSTLSALKDEVEKLVNYWESHTERYSDAKQKIGKVILCGQESGLVGLSEYLEACLGMKTVLADVWTNAFSLNNYIPPISRKDSLSYGPVIGLSLPQHNG